MKLKREFCKRNVILIKNCVLMDHLSPEIHSTIVSSHLVQMPQSHWRCPRILSKWNWEPCNRHVMLIRKSVLMDHLSPEIHSTIVSSQLVQLQPESSICALWMPSFVQMVRLLVETIQINSVDLRNALKLRKKWECQS